jgi:hypothetical protein
VKSSLKLSSSFLPPGIHLKPKSESKAEVFLAAPRKDNDLKSASAVKLVSLLLDAFDEFLKFSVFGRQSSSSSKSNVRFLL